MFHPSTGHRGITHILSLVSKEKHVLSETCHMMFSINANRKTSGTLTLI